MEKDFWSRALSSRVLNRRRVLAAGGALGSAAVLAACGSSGSSSSAGSSAAASSSSASSGSSSAASSAPAAKAQKGGRFTIILGDTISMNVVSNWSEGTWMSGQVAYDRPITSREDKRRYILEAMESIELPDPTTVVMKLKPGMVYHDIAPVSGRGVRSDDVAATQAYVTALPNAFDSTFQQGFLDKVETPDERTAIYRLKKPSAYLFSQTFLGSGTSQPIIPKETLDPAKIDGSRQVGSGPWYLDTFDFRNNYLYKRFDKFRDASKGLPYMDEWEVKIIVDPISAETSFLGGQASWYRSPTPNQIDSIPKNLGATAQLLQVPGLQNFFWHLNTEKGFPWDKDIRVREAFWRLTDRKQVLDLAYLGKGVVPTGLVPAGLEAYQLDAKDTASFYQQDIAKAKQLLSAANWDTSREWEILVGTPGSVTDQAAQIMQSQWLAGGIKTKINAVSVNTFIYWKPGNYEITMTGSPGSDAPAQAIRVQHSNSWSDTYRHFALHDPQIDALIEKSEAATDVNENVKLVKQIQMECIQKFTSSYEILTPTVYFLLNSKVQDFELTQVAPVYRTQTWLKS